MNLFVKYLAPFIRDYPQITLSRRFELEIQTYCMKLLGVKDMGELRDRYEGQKFLDNLLSRVSGYFVCANFLGASELTLEEILGKDKLSFNINGVSHSIFVFNFGELPQINQVDLPMIFILKKDNQTYSFCGIASIDVLKNETNFTTDNGKTYFTGFQKLSVLKKEGI
jgi:hypothetical protein